NRVILETTAKVRHNRNLHEPATKRISHEIHSEMNTIETRTTQWTKSHWGVCQLWK
ncbi:hypothetical protein SK128_005329, partial [Halocaridina rubra]